MPTRIQDEFSHLPRTMALYFRRKRDGKCIGCGKKRNVKGQLKCKACRAYKTAHYKKHYKKVPLDQRAYTPRPSKYILVTDQQPKDCTPSLTK